jgi:hypothetical protein
VQAQRNKTQHNGCIIVIAHDASIASITPDSTDLPLVHQQSPLASTNQARRAKTNHVVALAATTKLVTAVLGRVAQRLF